MNQNRPIMMEFLYIMYIQGGEYKLRYVLGTERGHHRQTNSTFSTKYIEIHNDIIINYLIQDLFYNSFIIIRR